MRMKTMFWALGALVVAACSSDGGSFEAAPTEVTKVTEEARDGYTYILYNAKQPAYRDRASNEFVVQRVDVGIPDGVETNAPVIFQIGGEQAISDAFVTNAPGWIGLPMIAVQAEHRGYGTSISSEEDQTTPQYLSRREAVDDFHEVVAALSEIYTGPWFVRGASYTGGVVLQYAAKYPEDVMAVSSASGVVDRWAMNPTYDPFTRELLGEESYAQLTAHIENLKPEEPFDQNWSDREFLQGVAIGLTQYESYQLLVPIFKDLIATQPTDQLVADLRELDQTFADGDAAAWAEHRALKTLSREESLQMQPNWRYYLWQQCTEIGEFRTPGSDGIWKRDEDDRDAECRELFGVGLAEEIVGHREDVVAMEDAGVSLVFVSGSKDPWSRVGLVDPPERDRIDEQERWSEYEASYGRHFNAPNGFHSPGGSDQELAQAVWVSMFELAGVELPE
jgi:pimeloyl-ACP methyl ester carboxylesterase